MLPKLQNWARAKVPRANIPRYRLVALASGLSRAPHNNDKELDIRIPACGSSAVLSTVLTRATMHEALERTTTSKRCELDVWPRAYCIQLHKRNLRTLRRRLSAKPAPQQRGKGAGPAKPIKPNHEGFSTRTRSSTTVTSHLTAKNSKQVWENLRVSSVFKSMWGRPLSGTFRHTIRNTGLSNPQPVLA